MPRLIPSRARRGGDPADDGLECGPAPRVRPYGLAAGGARPASGVRTALGARAADGADPGAAPDARTAGRVPAGPAGDSPADASESAVAESPVAESPAADRPVTGPAGATGLGVPAFAHPLVAPAEWAELARPGTPLHWTAFDVARGPGARPDPLYAQVLARVRENAVPVLGHLDCAYGARPFGELVTDASHYLDWYRVDGFYLGRAPTLASEIAETRRIVSTLRALLAQEHSVDSDGPHAMGDPYGRAREHGLDGVRIVLAPGVYPHPDYADIADQLVVFDGPWTRYRWSEAPQWSAAHPASRFAHLVHALPAAHLDAALRIARWQGAGTLCMTDRVERGGEDLPGTEAWSGLPTYWSDLVRRLRPEQEGAPSM